MTDDVSGDVGSLASPQVVREFTADGVAWLAILAGSSSAGSGAFGLGYLEGVDFALASEPDRPLREAFVQRGRFALLYDEEIIDLFASSNTITTRVTPRRPLDDRS